MKVEVRSTATLAKITRWLLLANVALILVAAVYQWKFMDLLRRISDGLPVTAEEVTHIKSVTALDKIGSLLVVIATATIFLRWLKRSYENLRFHNMTLRNSPGWAVGWWFIPFANFIKPYGIMSDFWRATGEKATLLNWNKQDKPSLIGWWWGCFLLGMLCTRGGGWALGRPIVIRDVEAMAAVLSIHTLGLILWIVAALLAYQLIGDLQGRLETKLQQLSPVGAGNGPDDDESSKPAPEGA